MGRISWVVVKAIPLPSGRQGRQGPGAWGAGGSSDPPAQPVQVVWTVHRLCWGLRDQPSNQMATDHLDVLAVLVQCNVPWWCGLPWGVGITSRGSAPATTGVGCHEASPQNSGRCHMYGPPPLVMWQASVLRPPRYPE